MTQLKWLIAPTALLALTVAAAPAFAQEKYHGRENRSSESKGEKAQPRGESRPQAGAGQRPETRQAAPRAQQSTPAPQPAPQTQPAPQAQRRQAEQPRAENRSNNDRQNQQRETAIPRNVAPRASDNRSYQGQAVPRTYAPHYAPHYAPRGYGYYGTRSYYRPYVFRPRFTIGFGIYAGYPVPYTYSYPYPIMVYGYRAPRTAVVVGPGSPYYGGIALEMTPYDADVWVDGTYAGRVEDFDGTTQPLTLTAGMHDIEVQAPGYEPMRMNVEVQPGQIIPYRGDLRRF